MRDLRMTLAPRVICHCCLCFLLALAGHTADADTLESQIDKLIAAGQTTNAIPLVQELVARRAAQPDKLAHAQALHVLGSIAPAELALPSLLQSLKLYQEANADTATLGAVEDAAGIAAQKLDRFQEAERLFRAAIEHRQSAGPEPWLNTTRIQLAKLLLIQGKYEASAELITLAIPETLVPDEKIGVTPGMVVQRLQVLAHYHQATGAYADAISALQRALALTDDAALHNDLGMALFRMKRNDEAQAEFETARKQFLAIDPPPQEALAACLTNLATIRISQYDGQGALEYLKLLPPADDKAAGIPRLLTMGVAQHLSGDLEAAQTTQTSAINRIRRDLGDHHPLLIQALTNAAAIAADQHHLDQAKAFAVESSLAARAWFANARGDADQHQLLAMRRAFDPISPITAFASDDLPQLAETILAMKGVVLREALAKNQKRDFADSKSPPTDAVFIDYVLHSVYVGTGRWAQRYSALLIRPGQPPLWIPIGEATAVQRQIITLLNAMESSVTAGTTNRTLSLQLQALHARLLPERLLGELHNQRVILRPDGLLHFVPWAILLDPKSSKAAPQFFCQSHPQVEVTAFANPLSPLPKQPTSWAVLTVPDKPKINAEDVPTVQRRLHDELKAMPDLPGTTREAQAIGKAVASQTKIGATEADLRTALKSDPTVLHLACHAFSLPNEAANEANDEGILKRCGLVFADATASGGGILFAEEAAELPLQNTDLILLSACQTGLGQADAGGDLTSLRHALLSAGARHVITALWSVDDAAAPEFMTLLYARLAKGESPSTALWQAQAEILEQSPDTMRAATQYGVWNLESAGWQP